MSKVLYYVLPNVDVVEFRAMVGSYVRGVPQPTSVAGLVHAVSLKLAKVTGMTLQQHAAVTYAVSNWSGFSGISRNSRDASGEAPAKRSAAGQIDDRVRASVRLSLIVELVVGDDDTPPTVAQFEQAVETSRLQAGSLFVRGGSRVAEDLVTALRYLPADSFVLVDASAEVEAGLAEAPTVEAIATLISRPTDGTYKAHFVPVLVGWRELAAPAVRAEQRAGAVAHAFAEPAIGVACFMSKGAARVKALSDAPALLWSYADTPLESHHVLVGAEPYIPVFEF